MCDIDRVERELTGFMPRPDELFRQALLLHQNGRFAEAEAIYQRLLDSGPDLAEVLVNCALAQLSQNRVAAAHQSLGRAVAAQPSFAKAHHHLGDVFCREGRFTDAVASYRRAVGLKPDYAEAYNNLGNALLHLGDLEGAISAYSKAISLKPAMALAYNNLGKAQLDFGFPDKAKVAFQKARALAPQNAEVLNNLGLALQKLGEFEDARSAFQAAILHVPTYSDAHANLAVSLMAEGKYAAAESAARVAVQCTPHEARAHDVLGNTLQYQGRLQEAEASYRRAIGLDPNYAEVHNHLGMVLEEYGTLDEAFLHFNRHATLTRERNARPADRASEHKKRHDAEQDNWRRARNLNEAVVEAPRLKGPAVNPGNDVQAISMNWRSNKPQIVVVDNFLTPEALESLRHFCMASTIWRKSFDEGYLGALPEFGFATPLVAQIAEELRAVYPDIIGEHPLLHFWGFKYDSELRGIKVHADFAAVNVNFWITPDDANLDPNSGGLVVWDAAAPLDWNFGKYNSANDDIRALLSEQNAKAIKVPYRANRAVIFDSDLFHETDEIRFKSGYENRRINVTLLFGRRGAARDDGTQYPSASQKT